MARFGTWSPLAANWAAQSRLTTPDIICVHTMVGSLAGTDAMFRRNGYGGTFSHFGIGGDGSCIQWQDTAFRAAANYNGNGRIISVECADMGAPFAAWNTADGSAVPAFSDAQIATLAELIRTIAPAHNIPIVLIPDALPGRRGVGYHRLGVPGYMVAGAEQWSTATGKVCPGNRRISQLPQVLARASNGDDMPTLDEIGALIDAKLRPIYDTLTPGISGVKLNGDVWAKVSAAADQLTGNNAGTLNHDLRSWCDANGKGIAQIATKVSQVQAPAVDPQALAAALLADEASVAKLGDAIAAGLARRVGSGNG